MVANFTITSREELPLLWKRSIFILDPAVCVKRQERITFWLFSLCVQTKQPVFGGKPFPHDASWDKVFCPRLCIPNQFTSQLSAATVSIFIPQTCAALSSCTPTSERKVGTTMNFTFHQICKRTYMCAHL